MTAPAGDHLRLITFAFLKFTESRGLPMPMASTVSEAIKPEVDALIEENRRLLAALERVSTWADGMEIDIMGDPSLAGRAIAQAVRDAMRGAQ